jgi:hypothetical protein
VAVDAARRDGTTGGVDLLATARELGGDRDDPAVLDAEVGREHVRRRRDPTVADHQIESSHDGCLSPQPSAVMRPARGIHCSIFADSLANNQ